MKTLTTSVAILLVLSTTNAMAACYDSSGNTVTDMDSLSGNELVRCYAIPERQYEEFANIVLIRSDDVQHQYFNGTAPLNPIGASSGETLASGITNNPPLGDYEWAIITSSRFTEVKASVDFPVAGSSATCSTTGSYTPSSASTLIASSVPSGKSYTFSNAKISASDNPSSTAKLTDYPYFHATIGSSTNTYQRAWVNSAPSAGASNGTVAIANADNFARSARGWTSTASSTSSAFGLSGEIENSRRPAFSKSISTTNANQMKYRVGIGSSLQIAETLSVDPNELVAFDVTVSIPDSAENGVEFLFQRYSGANYCLGWRRSAQDVSFDFYTVDADNGEVSGRN